MKIRVYQINSDKDENRMMFMAYDRLELFQGSSEIDCKIYDKVYDKEVDCSNLEEVYTLLNIHRPADYEGRSLSVSDVVEVYESDAVPSGFYFCDSVGFKQVTFHPEECGISERINGQNAEKISVLFVEPGKYPRMIEIEDSLEAMQDTVKGDIEEFMPYEDEVAIICNEESKMNGMSPNRAIYCEPEGTKDREMADIIFGPFFVCYAPAESEKFLSLPKELAQKYEAQFKFPERFFKHGDEIKAVPYAQRPDATAVLPIEGRNGWNRRFGRWVNRGATGIAVFDGESVGRSRLKYYFDISDTHESRFARPVPIWTMRPEYEPTVIESLENSFGELEDQADLASALLSAAQNAVEDNMQDYLAELKYYKESSFLEELDDLNIEVEYRRTLENSIGFMLLVRCGIDPANYFTDDDFRDVVDFNTPNTLNALGSATGDIGQMCLSTISRTALTLQRQTEKANRTFEEKPAIQYSEAEKDFPLIFPFGFNGVTIKKMDGKLKRCGNVDADNLLTESRLIKFIEPHSFRTQLHQRFFLYAGTGAFSRGRAPPYCVIASILVPGALPAIVFATLVTADSAGKAGTVGAKLVILNIPAFCCSAFVRPAVFPHGRFPVMRNNASVFEIE